MDAPAPWNTTPSAAMAVAVARPRRPLPMFPSCSRDALLEPTQACPSLTGPRRTENRVEWFLTNAQLCWFVFVWRIPRVWVGRNAHAALVPSASRLGGGRWPQYAPPPPTPDSGTMGAPRQTRGRPRPLPRPTGQHHALGEAYRVQTTG